MSGVSIVDALFFMLRWDLVEFHKKYVRTRYGKLGSLHPVRSAVHIVHSGASGARNGNALFFMLGCHWYGLDEKRTSTPCAELVFLHPVGSGGHVVHNGATGVRNVDALFFMLGCQGEVSKKSLSVHITLNMCFASSGIRGSRSEFRRD
jgi:hypothetical protein